ncbi:hypothetical protein L596_013344 [Steinernema carpocapsae]|uniref:Uncharacterized protein n=1 Tax=Steinernema carpocapsae TaxID=34508 RepID=A0A4V6A525_STECR|nr:hypothetical protein L596_013344 [Steinernema carpocapsae]
MPPMPVQEGSKSRNSSPKSVKPAFAPSTPATRRPFSGVPTRRRALRVNARGPRASRGREEAHRHDPGILIAA